MANRNGRPGRGGRARWAPLPAVLLVVLAIYNYDLPLRYLSWRTMSKAELVEQAEVYLENYTGGGQACLYAVDCRSGRAGLVLVRDVAAWDIEATKAIVWKRRFSAFCPGRTANLGLHVIPLKAGDAPPVTSNETARWSFYHDRFLPHWGRFQGGAFSEGDWEKCSEPYAVARRPPPPTPARDDPAAAPAPDAAGEPRPQ